MLKKTILYFLIHAGLTLAKATFHPNDYSSLTSTVNCPAIRRSPGPETQVSISLEYVDINPNATNTILMVHGWPSLWSSWARQIEEFQTEYRLIIPNLRGTGGSTHPGDVRSSGTMGDLAGDLMCILQHAGVHPGENVICMGHDWGSQVCYESARMRPDVISHVIGATVPYIPSAGPFIPISHFISVLPTLSYQIYFDSHTSSAIEELNLDKRRSLRSVLRTVDSPPPDNFLKSQDNFLGAWDGIEIPPAPFLSSEEEEYFVEAYEKQGFDYTLQFYMNENRYKSWELATAQGNITIPQPVLAIYPTQDPVADWAFAEKMLKSSAFLPHLTTKLMKGAHWMHIEYPEEFNTIVKDWLVKNVHPKIKEVEDELIHEEL